MLSPTLRFQLLSFLQQLVLFVYVKYIPYLCLMGEYKVILGNVGLLKDKKFCRKMNSIMKSRPITINLERNDLTITGIVSFSVTKQGEVKVKYTVTFCKWSFTSRWSGEKKTIYVGKGSPNRLSVKNNTTYPLMDKINFLIKHFDAKVWYENISYSFLETPSEFREQ